MFAGNWSRRVVLAVGLFYGLVGFSMGGGIALSLIDLAPGRVASLTMLSATGVQEMELSERAPLSVERTG
jgi:pimeloyl-ACP methyl ester carboxylesterase